MKMRAVYAATIPDFYAAKYVALRALREGYAARVCIASYSFERTPQTYSDVPYVFSSLRRMRRRPLVLTLYFWPINKKGEILQGMTRHLHSFFDVTAQVVGTYRYHTVQSVEPTQMKDFSTVLRL